MPSLSGIEKNVGLGVFHITLSLSLSYRHPSKGFHRCNQASEVNHDDVDEKSIYPDDSKFVY